MNQTKTECEDEIRMDFASIHRMIKDREIALIDSLNNVHQNKLQVIEAQIQQFKQNSAQLNQV